MPSKVRILYGRLDIYGLRISKRRLGKQYFKLGIWFILVLLLIFLVAKYHVVFRHVPSIEEYKCIYCSNAAKSKTCEAIYDDPNVIHVAMSADKNYLKGLLTAIYSVHINTKETVFFHIFTYSDGVDVIKQSIQRGRLKDITFEVVVVDRNLFKFSSYKQRHAQPMNWLRFYYPFYLSCIQTRILHLDTDLVLEGDVAELYNWPINDGHVIAAMRECDFCSFCPAYHYLWWLDTFVDTFYPTTINILQCTFNAGVYVLDVGRWKKHEVSKELEYWTMMNAEYSFIHGKLATQPPFWLAMHDKYTVLDSLWNLAHLEWCMRFNQEDYVREHGKLFHWPGAIKPWNDNSTFFSDIWWKYYSLLQEDTTH